ncbi:uncharacterized protein LOC125540220 isoform X1 [Triticum urartu]|uniref:uncharacterized protein LOC125540220 isoform X1 n=1 Tax=Triticum urartu TaxID=4572 RepID=UPI002044A471|nr:uncharacterized protein LOC125540220 isoform X1 [Triticum urartu]
MVVVLLVVVLQPLLLMVLRPAAAPPPPTSQTQQIEVAWPEQTVHLMAARRRGRRAGNGEGRRRGRVKKGSSGSRRRSRSWGRGKTKVEGEDGSFVLNIGWSALWFLTRDAARELPECCFLVHNSLISCKK